MSYNFKPFEEKLKEIDSWLAKEFAAIRTGRATIALLDKVMVDAYGVKTPLNQVGNINSEDARTLRVIPWDKSQINAIEKAITAADLGVSTGSDDVGIRVIFPELTSERRDVLIKQVGKKLEEAKISVRNERERVWSDIQAKEKAGEMAEDDKFRGKDDMQKLVDASSKRLQDLTDKKIEEIRS